MPKRTVVSLSQESAPLTKRLAFRPKKRPKQYPINGTVGRPQPFPIRMVATLRYCETIAITNSLTNIGNYNWACNSIYDPNLTGTGHQPYGHDTYASIYNQYTVLKAKITFRVSGNPNQFNWGGGIEDTLVPSAGLQDLWMERPTYKARIQAPAGAPDNNPITLYWDRAKRFPHEDLYRTVSAPFGANPSEVEVFNIVLQNATSTGVLGTCHVTVQIDYTCEFYELKDLGAS